MGYGIIRVEKVKASGLGALQHHVDREGHNHANPDIDIDRSHLNRAMVDRGDYQDFVWQRIAEGRTSARKVRKDAVVLVDGIVTASAEDMRGLTPEQRGQFFRDSLAFVEREFGAENVAYFTVHADETTLHAHFGAVPLKDGALSWKKFFATKYDLSKFQDRFYADVSQRYGLMRGEIRRDGAPVKRHRSVAQMKKQTERELDEARAGLDAAKCEREVLAAALEDARAEQRSIQAEIEAERERLERLRCACVERAKEAEQVERIADAVENFEHARIGSRRKALDQVVSIVKQAIAEVLVRIRSQIATVKAASLDAEHAHEVMAAISERVPDMRVPEPRPRERTSVLEDLERARKQVELREGRRPKGRGR